MPVNLPNVLEALYPNLSSALWGVQRRITESLDSQRLIITFEYVCGSGEGGCRVGTETDLPTRNMEKRHTKRGATEDHKVGWERGEGEAGADWEHLEKPQGRGMKELDLG